METFMKEFEHLKLQLKEIELSTDKFSDKKVIGVGGFGKVYVGKLSHYKGRSMVACKRLDRKWGQGDPEFWKEIMMLSRYTHENLISLLGFCDEGGEKILVYEHAFRGSLDRYLGVSDITWTQRIRICLDAARGICYLHDPKGTQQRVLHRDIKSANILLDANWNAKVSDMGLSKLAPANQKHTTVMTTAVGTQGYCDPAYGETGLLTQESDVYSFGVVLFEVLCGRLCFGKINGSFPILVSMWKESYEKNKLDEVIFQDLKQQMDSNSLESFSYIAYESLKRLPKERPKMADVVAKLEVALEYQELYERMKLPRGYKEIIKTAVPPLNYTSEGELEKLLLKGTLLNGGKTWLSLNMKGEHCELISIAECLTRIASESIYVNEHNSRFAVGSYKPNVKEFSTHVKTEFLSPGITYTVNLVLKNKDPDEGYIGLKYKLEGQRSKSYSFLSDEREDGWLTVELFQFNSENKNVDLKILFYIKHCQNILVEGIEFRPLEKVDHEVLDNENVDLEPISDSETFWEQKLPKDYNDIIKLSKHGVRHATKKELYSILREGFLINNDEEFSLAKDGKKCLMLSAKAALGDENWSWKSLPNIRFEVAHNPSEKFDIFYEIESGILSPQTTYAAYLVYKQEINYMVQPPPARVKDKNSRSRKICYIYLNSPQTPVIITGTVNHTHSPMYRPKIKDLPQQRSDSWMEVQIWEFCSTIESIGMYLELSSYDNTFEGIEVQGIELRPK